MVASHSVMVGSKTKPRPPQSESALLYPWLPVCVFEVQRARFPGDMSRGPVDPLLGGIALHRAF